MQTPMATHALPAAVAPSQARRDGMASALLVAAMGAFLVLGVGFLPVAAVHDAAHDTRHAIGFPCH
jgi:cobalt transporter subunit CbtB